jgi:hypothetical protein
MFFDNYGFIIIFLPFLIIYVLFFLILPFFVCGICLEQGQKKQPSKKGKTIAIFLLSVFSLELLCPLVTMPIDKKRYDDHKIYTKEKWQSSSMREKKIMIDDMEEKLTLMNASQDYVISNLGAPDKKETDEKDTSIENWSWLIDKDSWLDTVYTYFTVSFQNEKVIKYEVTYYYEN